MVVMKNKIKPELKIPGIGKDYKLSWEVDKFNIDIEINDINIDTIKIKGHEEFYDALLNKALPAEILDYWISKYEEIA